MSPTTSTAVANGTTLQAAGIFETANNFISNTQALLGATLIVVGLLVFIIAAWRTKTVPGIIGGLVAGGLVAGAGGIIIALSGVFSQTVQESGTASPEQTSYSQQYDVNELA